MICAVYSAKGGVGKTTIAVNLAWASAVLSGRRTLLWDLDGQAGASYVLRVEPERHRAHRGISGESDVRELIRKSQVIGLDVLPSDPSLNDLDLIFQSLGKRRRLAKIGKALAEAYETIIIDCPPGLTNTSQQIMRAADMIVVPVIPAMLSRRALTVVKQHLASFEDSKVVLAPVFSMVDRRRRLHLDQLDGAPGWPVIPMASAFERMSEERMPVGEFMPPDSGAVRAIGSLWSRIEQALG